jgi:hypothetical protein
MRASAPSFGAREERSLHVLNNKFLEMMQSYQHDWLAALCSFYLNQVQRKHLGFQIVEIAARSCSYIKWVPDNCI